MGRFVVQLPVYMEMKYCHDNRNGYFPSNRDFLLTLKMRDASPFKKHSVPKCGFVFCKAYYHCLVRAKRHTRHILPLPWTLMADIGPFGQSVHLKLVSSTIHVLDSCSDCI